MMTSNNAGRSIHLWGITFDVHMLSLSSRLFPLDKEETQKKSIRVQTPGEIIRIQVY